MKAFVSITPMACAPRAPKPAADPGPRPINRETPHIVLTVNGHPSIVVTPGRKVYAIAKGEGVLKGGWRCMSILWRTDETGWKQTGTDPGAQCGETAETWVWPEGPGREYRFDSPGSHEVCVEVQERHGWLVGTRQCAAVVVVGGSE